MGSKSEFPAAISEEIWKLKYQLKTPHGAPLEHGLDDTFARVARAGARVEPGGRKKQDAWAARFKSAIDDFGFIPAGRILAGAGSGRAVTLFNCFVMGPVEDDLSGIFDAVKRAAKTMQSGGGIGIDFSTLRPKGSLVAGINAGASGPVSFMGVWDAMCQTILSAGARRGAMMATLRADHPDIELFIDAKNTPGALTNFNLSVLASDAFVAAVREDQPWDLVFDGTVYRTVRARALWDRMMRSNYDFAEPGVIFIDRVNAQNNLSYCETIFATNPCGEQPLPPFGACLLGSINLTQFVSKPFSADADVVLADIEERVRVAVRLLDNMIDVSRYPLKRQKREACTKRRIGLGITGLADALIMCGLEYGSRDGVTRAQTWMAAIQNAAYRASAELAAEKGTFPLYDRDEILNAPNVVRLAPDVRKAIKRHGLRNGCLTSIAPTGTISLLAGNVSSGIEPVWDFTYKRAVTQADGSRRFEVVDDYALLRYREMFGSDAPLPATFVKAGDLTPRQHLEMQAALQPYVDSAISKTINCPEDLPFDGFKDIYAQAYDLGLKGCTTYRPSPVRGAVLEPMDAVSEHSAGKGATTKRDDVAAANEIADTARLGATEPTGVPEAGKDPSTIVYMSKPLERAHELHGITYKLKWPGSDHAIYVTINDIELDGRRRPFEIFINTRNLEHYSWTVALTRMISAVFRRGGDVSFVAEELKAVFDPQGGSWMGGRYVPSLLAAIGDVIETHMRKIGFSGDDEHAQSASRRLAQSSDQHEALEDASLMRENTTPRERGDLGDAAGTQTPANVRRKLCPRCNRDHLVRRESCWECHACGFSRCD